MGANRELYIGDLEAASRRIPADKPYVMMNMIKFRPVAQYPETFKDFDSTSAQASLSGRDAYAIYRNEFGKRAVALGVPPADILFLGQAHTNIIAGLHEGEEWDVVLLVRFHNFAGFRSVLEDDVYINDIQPHRVAAVQDFRSFAVTEKNDL